MKIRTEKVINADKDLILAFRKGKVDQSRVKALTGIPELDFKGEFCKYQLVYSKTGSRIYLLGLGDEKKNNRIHEAFRSLVFNERKYWKNEIQIDLLAFDKNEILLTSLGIGMAYYNIAAFKTDREEKTESELDIVIVTQDECKDIITEGSSTADTINSIKALVDAPPNIKTPAYLAKWASDSAAANGYEVKIWDEKELTQNGFGAIMAVGKGSQYPPRMIVSTYKAKKNSDNVDLALVGKGVTFDTGGISIKPSNNLHYMKSDMGGAAAVLGIVELVAKLQLNVNIIGIVCAAENAVDAKSFLPGDVINSHSGKTIEIIDTDAEGRLVMADGISYAIKEFKPDRLIDMATLTGSTVRTLGYYAAGIFSHNDEMVQTLKRIGDEIFERVWPLPIFDELEDDLHSDIADVRNFGGRPVAGASAAAKFLEFFTEEHENWVHLDIAGVAFGSSDYAKMKSASGYGVRLLTEYIKTFENPQ